MVDDLDFRDKEQERGRQCGEQLACECRKRKARVRALSDSDYVIDRIGRMWYALIHF